MEKVAKRPMRDKLIIWNFFGTLYDPVLKTAISPAGSLLKEATESGYINILYTANPADDATVSESLARLGWEKYFAEVVVRREKNLKDLYGIINRYHYIDPEKRYLISDRAWIDIKLGNQLELKTFWLRVGKYASEAPREGDEDPWVTIYSLAEMLGCFYPDYLI